MQPDTTADYEHFVVGAIHEVTPRTETAVLAAVQHEVDVCGVHGLVVDLSEVDLKPEAIRRLIAYLDAAPLEGHWRIRIGDEEIIGTIPHAGPARRPA